VRSVPSTVGDGALETGWRHLLRPNLDSLSDLSATRVSEGPIRICFWTATNEPYQITRDLVRKGVNPSGFTAPV
jgi:hypothetical protein